MKNLLLVCGLVLSLFASTAEAHNPVLRTVARTACATCKVVSVPVKVVNRVQPVRRTLHVMGHPVERVVRLSLVPVRFVLGR